MKKYNILFSLLLFAFWGCENGNQNSDQTNVNEEPTPVVEQQAPPAAMQPVYVLGDKLGERFLLRSYFDEGTTPQPHDSLKNYKYIVCGNGKYYPVRFAGCQMGDAEKNNGRDTYVNFDNISGWLYEMENGRLLENPMNEYDAVDGGYLLVDEHFKNIVKILDEKNIVDGQLRHVDVSDDIRKAIENRYGRTIQTIYASSVFGDNSEYQLVNVQFENQGTDALAVVALVENGVIKAVKDFPAQYDEFSTWREGDEGEFNGFNNDLIVLEDGTLTLYTVNFGEEGSAYQNYVVKGDSLCQGNIQGYFYYYPE